MRNSHTLTFAYLILIFPIISWAASSALSQETATENNTTILQTESTEPQKQIIGAVEKVRVIPGNFVFDARIDTGATTSSLGVDSYEIVTEDGEEMVEITLEGQKSKHQIVRFIRIKEHEDNSKKRPVIRMRLILGDVSESVDVTLANRSNFTYKLLIGRNLLYDRFIVDVSQKHTVNPMPYKE